MVNDTTFFLLIYLNVANVNFVYFVGLKDDALNKHALLMERNSPESFETEFKTFLRKLLAALSF